MKKLLLAVAALGLVCAQATAQTPPAKDAPSLPEQASDKANPGNAATQGSGVTTASGASAGLSVAAMVGIGIGLTVVAAAASGDSASNHTTPNH
ncbi:hypothetical protein [Massilia glaciei]|uniref:Uncharacterized protein n=1 Tax=Massilia glaciei TaxID=1524097 RepID=A0A2U2HHT4_9BURK|nr:hypothetical protein [Massilia glaciei]PWF45481.1 hypothetical protein C7C56_017570 [Massilia glaciei]